MIILILRIKENNFFNYVKHFLVCCLPFLPLAYPTLDTVLACLVIFQTLAQLELPALNPSLLTLSPHLIQTSNPLILPSSPNYSLLLVRHLS